MAYRTEEYVYELQENEYGTRVATNLGNYYDSYDEALTILLFANSNKKCVLTVNDDGQTLEGVESV